MMMLSCSSSTKHAPLAGPPSSFHAQSNCSHCQTPTRLQKTIQNLPDKKRNKHYDLQTVQELDLESVVVSLNVDKVNRGIKKTAYIIAFRLSLAYIQSSSAHLKLLSEKLPTNILDSLLTRFLRIFGASVKRDDNFWPSNDTEATSVSQDVLTIFQSILELFIDPQSKLNVDTCWSFLSSFMTVPFLISIARCPHFPLFLEEIQQKLVPILSSCLGASPFLIQIVLSVRAHSKARAKDQTLATSLSSTLIYHPVFPFFEFTPAEKDASHEHSDLFVPTADYLQTANYAVLNATEDRRMQAPDSRRQYVTKWTMATTNRLDRKDSVNDRLSVELRKHVISTEDRKKNKKKGPEQKTPEQTRISSSTLGFSTQHRLTPSFWTTMGDPTASLAFRRADSKQSRAETGPKENEKAEIGEKDLSKAGQVITILFNLLNTIGPFLIPETVLLIHSVCLLAHTTTDTHGALTSALSHFVATFCVYYIFATPALLLFVMSTCQSYVIRTELMKDKKQTSSSTPKSASQRLFTPPVSTVQPSVFQELLEVCAIFTNDLVQAGTLKEKDDPLTSSLYTVFLTSKVSPSHSNAKSFHTTSDADHVSFYRRKRAYHDRHTHPASSPIASLTSMNQPTQSSPTSSSLVPYAAKKGIQISGTLSRIPSRVTVSHAVKELDDSIEPALSLDPLVALVDTPSHLLSLTIPFVTEYFEQNDMPQHFRLIAQAVSAIAVAMPIVFVRSLLVISKTAKSRNQFEKQYRIPTTINLQPSFSPLSTPFSSDLSLSSIHTNPARKLQDFDRSNTQYDLASPAELRSLWAIMATNLNLSKRFTAPNIHAASGTPTAATLFSSYQDEQKTLDSPPLAKKAGFSVMFYRNTSRFFGKMAELLVRSSFNVIRSALESIATKGEFEFRSAHSFEPQTLKKRLISMRGIISTAGPAADPVRTRSFIQRTTKSSTSQRLSSNTSSLNPAFLSDYAVVSLVSIIRVLGMVTEPDQEDSDLADVVTLLWTISQSDDFVKTTQSEQLEQAILDQSVPSPNDQSPIHPRLLFLTKVILRITHSNSSQLGQFMYSFARLVVKIGKLVPPDSRNTTRFAPILSLREQREFGAKPMRLLVNQFFSDSRSIRNANLIDFLRKLIQLAQAPITPMLHFLQTSLVWPSINVSSNSVSFSFSQSLPQNTHTDALSSSPFSVDTHTNTFRQNKFPILLPSLYSPLHNESSRFNPHASAPHKTETCPFCLGDEYNKQFCSFYKSTAELALSSPIDFAPFQPRSPRAGSLDSPLHTRSLSAGTSSDLLQSQNMPISPVPAAEQQTTPKSQLLFRSTTVNAFVPINVTSTSLLHALPRNDPRSSLESPTFLIESSPNRMIPSMGFLSHPSPTEIYSGAVPFPTPSPTQSDQVVPFADVRSFYTPETSPVSPSPTDDSPFFTPTFRKPRTPGKESALTISDTETPKEPKHTPNHSPQPFLDDESVVSVETESYSSTNFDVAPKNIDVDEPVFFQSPANTSSPQADSETPADRQFLFDVSSQDSLHEASSFSSLSDLALTQTGFGSLMFDTLKSSQEETPLVQRKKNNRQQLVTRAGIRVEMEVDENLILNPFTSSRDFIFAATLESPNPTVTFFLPSYTPVFVHLRKPDSIAAFNDFLYEACRVLDVALNNIFRLSLFESEILSFLRRLSISLSPFIRVFAVEAVGLLLQSLMLFLTSNTSKSVYLLQFGADKATPLHKLHESLLVLFSFLRLLIRCNPYTDVKETSTLVLHHFIESWMAVGFPKAKTSLLKDDVDSERLAGSTQSRSNANTDDQTLLTLPRSAVKDHSTMQNKLREDVMRSIILAQGELLECLPFPTAALEPRHDWNEPETDVAHGERCSWGHYLFKETQLAYEQIPTDLDILLQTEQLTRGTARIRPDTRPAAGEDSEDLMRHILPSPIVSPTSIVFKALEILQLIVNDHISGMTASNTALIQRVLEVPTLSVSLSAFSLLLTLSEYAEKKARNSDRRMTAAALSKRKKPAESISGGSFAKSFTFPRMLSLHIISQLILSPAIELRTAALSTISSILSSIRIQTLSSMNFFFALLDKLITTIHSLWMDLLFMSKDTARSLLQPPSALRTPTAFQPHSPQFNNHTDEEDHKHIEHTIVEIVKMIADILHAQLPFLLGHSHLLQGAFVVGETLQKEDFSLTLAISALVLNLVLFGTTELADAAFHLSHTIFFKAAEIHRSFTSTTCQDKDKTRAQLSCTESFTGTIWDSLQLFLEMSISGCSHRNTKLFLPATLHSKLSTIARSVSDIKMPFFATDSQDSPKSELSMYAHCPLCALIPSKATTLLLLLSPFIPRAIPRHHLHLEKNPFTLVADTSTYVSNTIKFKTALLSSVGLDVDSKYTDALKREGDISRVSQLSTDDILELDEAVTRISTESISSGGIQLADSPLNPNKLTAHQPTSLFRYHPFFSGFIRTVSHLSQHRYLHTSHSFIPPISQAILDPLTSFTSASSHPSRLARIARVQNNAFVRCLLPLVKASSFDLNTSAHNLQQLGIGIHRSFSDGVSDSVSPSVLPGGRRPSQKGPLEWHVDSGLYALLETDPQSCFSCCSVFADQDQAPSPTPNSLPFHASLPMMTQKEEIQRCIVILTLVFTTHSPFLIPFLSPSSAVSIDPITGHIGHRFVSPPSGPYLDQIITILANPRTDLDSSHTHSEETFDIDSAGDVEDESNDDDEPVALSPGILTSSTRRTVTLPPPIRLPAKILPSDRIVLNSFWPLLPHPCLLTTHVFPSISNVAPDLEPSETVRSHFNSSFKRHKLHLPFVHNQTLHGLAFMTPFILDHLPEEEGVRVGLLQSVALSLHHLLCFSLTSFGSLNTHLISIGFRPSCSPTSQDSPFSTAFLSLPAQNRMQVQFSFMMGVKMIAVVLQNITLLVNSLLTSSSFRLLFDFFVELVPPLVSLHRTCPPLRQTISATLLVFFTSILDPDSAFFHTLHSDILSSLFAVLSEVLAIVAPQPASKEQPFSHLTILVDPPQLPASQSSSLPSLIRLKESLNEFPSSSIVFQPLPAVVCVSYSEFTTHFSSFLFAVEDMADVTDSDFRTTLIRSAAQVAVNAFNSAETTGTRDESLSHDVFCQQLNTILTHFGVPFRAQICEARVAAPPSVQANAPRSAFHSPSNQKGSLIDDLIDSPSSSFVISKSGRATPIDISNDPQVIIQRKNEAITATLEDNALTVKSRDRKESGSFLSSHSSNVIHRIFDQRAAVPRSAVEDTQNVSLYSTKVELSDLLTMLTCSPLIQTQSPAQPVEIQSAPSVAHLLSGPLVFHSSTPTFTSINCDEDNTARMWSEALSACLIPAAAEYHLRRCSSVPLAIPKQPVLSENEDTSQSSQSQQLSLNQLLTSPDSVFLLNFAAIRTLLTSPISSSPSVHPASSPGSSLSPLLSLLRTLLQIYATHAQSISDCVVTRLSTSFATVLVPHQLLLLLNSVFSLLRTPSTFRIQLDALVSLSPSHSSSFTTFITTRDVLWILTIPPFLSLSARFFPTLINNFASVLSSSTPSQSHSMHIPLVSSTLARSIVESLLSLPPTPLASHFLAHLEHFTHQQSFYSQHLSVSSFFRSDFASDTHQPLRHASLPSILDLILLGNTFSLTTPSLHCASRFYNILSSF
ncbi:hypothetical protein BLNAU_15653 [Blattamonas nauphoetae]|uniref:Uncharacterized protein n=1 Tax=Blattamonas nauphoetae TaxID=2049346 RepID=A0ABQ9XDS7_9EUKA|nr:hypothetical protein BLNAU_15653 [Blattamonas nauphoetae]